MKDYNLKLRKVVHGLARKKQNISFFSFVSPNTERGQQELWRDPAFERCLSITFDCVLSISSRNYLERLSCFVMQCWEGKYRDAKTQ